ncbi:MAG: tRNA 4-thiouridine(8) synthase ThiI [Syntrophomonadaceae bacterium]
MKAISLFSGGLDSQLAVCLIKEQGIEVAGVNFCTPFFGASKATIKAADDLNIKLHIIDIGSDYLKKVLLNPVYGYGKNLNPCIDCHAFMLNQAGNLMKELNASFLITGEVLGQRPMSQNRSALMAVDKLSGYRGLILRPLSAKLLPETIPEAKGWINRDQLLDISGRDRSRQIDLAEKYNLRDYPSPAGGCLLTENRIAIRIKNMLKLKPDSSIDELKIVRLGRHFNFNGNLLIVGRNHSENEQLLKAGLPGDYWLKVVDYPGPIGLLRWYTAINDQDLNYAASIVARYSDAKNQELVTVKVFLPEDTQITTVKVKPLSIEESPATL